MNIATHQPATVSQAPASVVQVREVLMHRNPHLDEIFAYYLLTQYGEKMFPGLSEAAVRFAEGDVNGTDEEFERDGILAIGCGKGRFDEHRGPDERLAGECTTTLVAKHLGVQSKPELKRIIEEILYFDTHSGCTATQLPELLKVLHRTTKSTHQVLDWALIALNALKRQESYHFAQVANEKSLVEVMKQSVADGLYSESDRVKSFMFEQVHNSERRKEKSVLELASIVEAMYRSGYTYEQVSEWLVDPMDRMLMDQIEFWKEVELIKSKKQPIWIQSLIRGEERDLNLLVLESDSSQAQKAGRYLGAEVVVVRSSTGNTQIYVDTRISGLNLSNAARMIRWLELPVEKKGMHLWHDLGCEGDHPAIGGWYYFKRGEMLFNGSQTRIEKPTKLPTQALIDVMKHAFHPRGVSIWTGKRGIQVRSS